MDSSRLLFRMFETKTCFKGLVCLMLGFSLLYCTVALGQNSDKNSGQRSDKNSGKKKSVSSTKQKSGEPKSSKNPSYFSLDFNGTVGVGSTEPAYLKKLKEVAKAFGYEEKEDFPLGASVELGYNQGFKGFTLSGSGVFFVHQYKVVYKDKKTEENNTAEKKNAGVNFKTGGYHKDVMPTGFGGKLGGRVNVTDNFALGLNGTFNVFVKLFGNKMYSGKYMGVELVSSAKVAQRFYLKFIAGTNLWQPISLGDSIVNALTSKEEIVYPFVPKFYVLLGFHLNIFQVS
ncbi:MAG: hypothetical protein OXC44_01245 [Proteobacteria bacterium]|nr:hypothetical protein [Pseudomonadota bacterium]